MSAASSTFDIPKEPAARRAWVLYQLRLRGWSFNSLAKRHGVSRQTLSMACLIPSSHMERILAKALGLKVEDLFPERFDAATGRRLHVTRAPQRTTQRAVGQRQKKAAA